jgi:hypothetical protein
VIASRLARAALVAIWSCVACLLASPGAAQVSAGKQAPSSAAPIIVPVPRGCPVAAAAAQVVSPGDVRVNPGDPDRDIGLRPVGRTVFYSRIAAADSGARKKAATVHTRSSGEIAAGGLTTTAPKHTSVPHLTRRARGWTVQVASYETLDAAQAMQQTLCARGYEARITGMTRPYGVRVGRFASSDSALTVARRLSSRRLTVFVTAAE